VTLSELRDAWKLRADTLERYSPAAAEAFRQAALELDTAIVDWLGEPLTLEQAEAESGYTRAHLRRLIREKTIPVLVRESDGVEFIRRRDLPKKPGFCVANSSTWPYPDRARLARAVARGE
jgi:hypothetical protein